MVSMKDIAERCGVSIATVSKALNGRQDIGRETRMEICSVASEMGYTANSAARSLKTNRTYNLGVLYVDEGSRGLTHEFFAAVLESFKSEAEKCGYDITFISCNVGANPMSCLQHCMYRGVDGVMIACTDFDDPQITELVSSSLPVVTIDHSFKGRMAVFSDNKEGASALVGYAFSRGHRKIAFIHGENTDVTKRRLEGFRKACEDAGLEVPDCYIRQSAFYDADKCYADTLELLKCPERPTCIMFPDDFSLICGLRALNEAGLRVPDDISVIGYDGIVVSQVMFPRITTYRQDTVLLGKTAASRLIELIEHPEEASPYLTIVPGRLLEGESVKTVL